MGTIIQQHTVVRTSMGLTIRGTRITLYHVLDDLKAGMPAEAIQAEFELTKAQMQEVLDYIELHRDEVEAEYQLVLKQAEANRQYWEQRNREHFAAIEAQPPKPGQDELRTKLKAWKAIIAARQLS